MGHQRRSKGAQARAGWFTNDRPPGKKATPTVTQRSGQASSAKPFTSIRRTGEPLSPSTRTQAPPKNPTLACQSPRLVLSVRSASPPREPHDGPHPAHVLRLCLNLVLGSLRVLLGMPSGTGIPRSWPSWPCFRLFAYQIPASCPRFVCSHGGPSYHPRRPTRYVGGQSSPASVQSSFRSPSDMWARPQMRPAI